MGYENSFIRWPSWDSDGIKMWFQFWEVIEYASMYFKTFLRPPTRLSVYYQRNQVEINISECTVDQVVWHMKVSNDLVLGHEPDS